MDYRLDILPSNIPLSFVFMISRLIWRTRAAPSKRNDDLSVLRLLFIFVAPFAFYHALQS
jgi:hypothetical protein